MKTIADAVPRGELERLRAARINFSAGRYTCLACMDNGLLYARMASHGRTVVGIAPCTECDAGAARHLNGSTCIWARGSRPCPLCGAYEGEQVPAGWKPEPPTGFIAYDELASLGRDDAER